MSQLSRRLTFVNESILIRDKDMKRCAFIASIALNLSLALALVWAFANRDRLSGQPIPVALASPATSATRVASNARPSAQARFVWSELESTNYLEYVERLKGVQCPWPTICDLIIGEINRLYAPKIAALQRSTSPPYWKSRSFMDPRHDPEVQGRLRAL